MLILRIIAIIGAVLFLALTFFFLPDPSNGVSWAYTGQQTSTGGYVLTKLGSFVLFLCFCATLILISLASFLPRKRQGD